MAGPVIDADTVPPGAGRGVIAIGAGAIIMIIIIQTIKSMGMDRGCAPAARRAVIIRGAPNLDPVQEISDIIVNDVPGDKNRAWGHAKRSYCGRGSVWRWFAVSTAS